MKSFVVPRKSNAEYDRMVEMYTWCRKNFGNVKYDKSNWTSCFAGTSTDDYVRFIFYDESMATLFVLRWNVQLEDEFAYYE